MDQAACIRAVAQVVGPSYVDEDRADRPGRVEGSEVVEGMAGGMACPERVAAVAAEAAAKAAADGVAGPSGPAGPAARAHDCNQRSTCWTRGAAN